MKVIINADDLGISEIVNNSIFNLMSKGRLTSATLMANGPAILPALNEIRHFPGQSFGIHLNLTEFKPLASTPHLAPLLGGNGELSLNIEKIRVTPSLMCAIAEEFSRQIEFLLARGVVLSHIDSHRHVHTLPLVFPALKYVQRKFRIGCVRITRSMPRHARRYTGLAWAKKAAYNFCLRHVVRTRTTDGFTDLRTFTDIAKRQSLPDGIYEIMVHPGADAHDDALLPTDWESALPFPVRFINYHQL